MKGADDAAIRTAHLIRVDSYMDYAILSMWISSPRVDMLLGMLEASLKGEGPGARDEDLLEKVRALVKEGRAYLQDGDFFSAMGRMRTAHDLLSLRIISLAGE